MGETPSRTPLDELEALVESGKSDDVPAQLLFAAAGQATQLLGEALERAVAMYNLMSGLMDEFVVSVEPDETEKENA